MTDTMELKTLATDKGFLRLLSDQCITKASAKVFFDGQSLDGQLLKVEGDTLAIAVQFERFDIRIAYIPTMRISALILGQK